MTVLEHSTHNLNMRALFPHCFLFFATLSLLPSCRSLPESDPQAGAGPHHERKSIVAFDTGLKGRVYIAREEPDAEQLAAEDVRIRIMDEDNRETLVYTHTDEEGFYEVNRVAIGRYFLHIGDLVLPMTIVDHTTVDQAEEKEVVVVVPRDLLYEDEREEKRRKNPEDEQP